MATCEPLKHARCDIIMGAFIVMRRGDRCVRIRPIICYNHYWFVFDNNLPIPDTDYGTCESEPGFCHADSLFRELKRGTDYTRNCGVHHPSWRIARKAERRL